MGPALRIDVLDDIIAIAKKSVDRMCDKIKPLQGTGALLKAFAQSATMRLR